MILSHDGYTTDHISEYCFMQPGDIRLLWSADEDAYVYSTSIFLQSLLMSEKLRIPIKPTRNRECVDRLHSILADRQLFHSDTASHISARSKTSPSYKKLQSNWKEIRKIIQNSPKLQRYLVSHIKRETFYRIKRNDSGRKSSYYIKAGKSFTLDGVTEKNVLLSLPEFYRKLGEVLYAEELQKWIRPNIATHFLNFFENVLSSGRNYLPGLTRTEILSQMNISVRGVMNSYMKAIAFDMIKKAKTRDKIIPCTLDWIESKKGQKIKKKYLELTNLLSSPTEDERNKCINEINRISEELVSRPMDIFLKIIDLGTSVVKPQSIGKRARDLLETVSKPGYYTFLYRYKHKDHLLRKKLRDLLV